MGGGGVKEKKITTLVITMRDRGREQKFSEQRCFHYKFRGCASAGGAALTLFLGGFSAPRSDLLLRILFFPFFFSFSPHRPAHPNQFSSQEPPRLGPQNCLVVGEMQPSGACLGGFWRESRHRKNSLKMARKGCSDIPEEVPTHDLCLW